MKIVKMSLVAALLVGSSAFAIENVKVSGDAKLFYSTQNNSYDTAGSSLFSQVSSMGEAAFGIGATADLADGVSAGAKLNVITTLGLENRLVSQTWTGGVEDNTLYSEAWLAKNVGNTTLKAGRMELDTPLVFSEVWSIIPSTFETVVAINSDLPDTTLVGAYVGESNAAAVLGGGISEAASTFVPFYDGAYAIGAVNNSVKPLTAQAWYYNAPDALGTPDSTLSALWVQGDVALDDLSFGVQYTTQTLGSEDAQSAMALKVGYEMKDTFAASFAYSSVASTTGNTLANVGSNLAGSQSKLYTEAWWYYGVVSLEDTTAMNITVTAPVAGYDLGLYYTQATVGKDGVTAATEKNFTEATFEVAKSFGALDTGVYYIYTKSDMDNVNVAAGDTEGTAYHTAQVYLTYNF